MDCQLFSRVFFLSSLHLARFIRVLYMSFHTCVTFDKIKTNSLIYDFH